VTDLHRCVMRLHGEDVTPLDAKAKEFRKERLRHFTRAAMFRAGAERWIAATKDWTSDQLADAIRPALVPSGRKLESPLKRYALHAPQRVLVRLDEIVVLVSKAIPQDRYRSAVLRTAVREWNVITKDWTLDQLAEAIRPSLVPSGRRRVSLQRGGAELGETPEQERAA
jgi:hypothetical protein